MADRNPSERELDTLKILWELALEINGLIFGKSLVRKVAFFGKSPDIEIFFGFYTDVERRKAIP